MKSWIERLDIVLSILVILEIAILTVSLLLDFGDIFIDYILIFDTVLSIILIFSFFFKLQHSEKKSRYLRENYLDLIASIPLLVLAIPFGIFHIHILNLMVLLRFLKLLLLFKQSYKLVKRIFNATSLDKIIALFLVVILVSTFTLEYFDPAIGDLYQSLWFVFQTITTVGYGDVVPKSPIGRFIGFVLLVVGVLMFSVFTASFAYIFNDRVFKEENEEFNEKVNSLKKGIEKNRNAVEEIRESSLSSREEIQEIKEKLDKTDESIKKLEANVDYLIGLVEKNE